MTGASGFLGCRLVERLVLAEKAQVRALAHRPGKALRLARLPVEIAWGDLRAPASLAAAVADCEVVVHCAALGGNDRRASREVNVEGTRRLARAAAAAGVRRFVHISSIAVHSYSPSPGVEESSPMLPCGDPYADNKIRAEREVRRLMRNGELEVTVLRLGNLFGPFSAAWTVRPLQHLRDGLVTLVDEGAHASNAVFVDNAIDAILLAVDSQNAVGETFFVTDEPLTWREWYGQYARWLGEVPLVSISSGEVESVLRPPVRKRLRLGLALPIWYKLRRAAVSKALFQRVRDRVPPSTRGRLTVDAERARLPRLPPAGLLARYASHTVFSNAKAKRLLGFASRTSPADAFEVTRAWASWARLL